MVEAYKGKERRSRKIRTEEVRGIAMRMIREGVHIDELEAREDDPENLVERTRGYVKSLIERPEDSEKQPGNIWAPGIEGISEDTSWLLPGSDVETKRKFIKVYGTLRGNLLRAVLLILARSGLETKVSEKEMIKQIRQMLPDIDSIRGGLKVYRNLNPKRMQRIGFHVSWTQEKDKNFFLELS